MTELPNAMTPIGIIVSLAFLLGISVWVDGRKGLDVLLYDWQFICFYIALLALAADYFFFGYLPVWGE